MKISIITAVYNCENTIEHTILSVASQSYADVEHIVIDGASTDGTMSVVMKHQDKIARYVSEPDNGIYDAMNKGLALATGDVIGFLNADDMYADSAVLDRVAAALSASDPAADACYGDLVYVTPADLNKVVRYWKSCNYKTGLFAKGWMPAHPTFFVYRRVYDALGGFDLQFKLQSDFDLTMRFMELGGIRSVYIPRVLVKMRTGGVTNSGFLNVLKGNMEAYRACKKNGLQVTPFFMLKKVASRLRQFYGPAPGSVND